MIYVASPYYHDEFNVRERRYYDVMNFIVWATECLSDPQGMYYSPIVYWHQTAIQFDLPKDADFWRDINTRELQHCSQFILLLLDGVKESKGCAFELLYAQEHNIPVRFFKHNGDYTWIQAFSI